MRQRSALDIAIKLLSFSFVTYIILFVSRLVVSMLLLGAAFGGSGAGFSFGIALLFISDAAVLFLGGYLISAKAMHAGKGWLYGAGCAACVVFGWQLMACLIFQFLVTGKVYLPLFTLVAIPFTLFLEIPTGALGGLVAEKSYRG